MKTIKEILDKHTSTLTFGTKEYQQTAMREAMIEYATSACEEQRIICSKEAYTESVGSPYMQIDEIYRPSILEAPLPIFK